MTAMKPFSSSLQKSLRQLTGSSELAAKAARVHQVKTMWKGVVEPVFLEHTNSVYIIRKDDEKHLIVYVDDSIFAAELNARREMIKLKLLSKFNEKVDEFKILISRGSYKKNYPFKEDGTLENMVVPAARLALDPQVLKELEEQVRCIPDESLRKSLLKAMISDLEIKNAKNHTNNGKGPL